MHAEGAGAGRAADQVVDLDWREIDLENGSLRRAAEIVGDKWVMMIVRDAMLGITRFDDLQSRLGLSAPVLSNRLRRLVREGILAPAPYREPGQRTRTEYRLTHKGAELFHALVAVMQWGDRYLADPEGPALTFRHEACGCEVSVRARCSVDGSDLEVGQTFVAPGPGARRAEPRRRTAADGNVPVAGTRQVPAARENPGRRG